MIIPIWFSLVLRVFEKWSGRQDLKPCLACGSPSTRIELVAPGELPVEWEQWDSRRQGFFLLHREPERRHLIFKGVAAENGYGGDP